jgi:hypothetical protein
MVFEKLVLCYVCGFWELGTWFLEAGALETCIYIHISWCVCVCCFYDRYISICMI